jgi:hypothetical protein
LKVVPSGRRNGRITRIDFKAIFFSRTQSVCRDAAARSGGEWSFVTRHDGIVREVWPATAAWSVSAGDDFAPAGSALRSRAVCAGLPARSPRLDPPAPWRWPLGFMARRLATSRRRRPQSGSAGARRSTPPLGWLVWRAAARFCDGSGFGDCASRGEHRA